MTLKTYSQCCALASALDIVGDRWTWLIIRALLCGPCRFSDLMEQLPGMGTNLLSARLRRLAETGVIIKRGRGRQSAYELTETGEGLREIAYSIAQWGSQFEPYDNKRSLPQWAMFNLEASFLPQNAGDLDAVVEFNLEGFTFHIVIRKGVCRSRKGPAIAPDVTIHSPDSNLMGSKARLRIEGDRDITARVQQCFRFVSRQQDSSQL